MRIVDSVPEASLSKVLLIEDNGQYAILQQATHRPPAVVSCTLTEGQAFEEWRDRVYRMFYAVTHNENDSEAMTSRRLETLH